MFQIGDLVKYDSNSRWRTSRTDEYEENEKTGIIMSITAFKDITQSEVQVHVQLQVQAEIRVKMKVGKVGFMT